MTIEEAKQSFLTKLNSGALTPVVNSANQAPPSTQPPSYPAAPNPFLRTPLPSVAVLQPDMARQFFNPATPQFRSMPPTPSSNPAVGAAVISNTVVNNSTVNTTGMLFKGTWAAYATYATSNIVLFNNSAYVAIQKSMGAEPDTTPSAWTLIAKNLNFRGRWNPGYVQSARQDLSNNTVAATFSSNNAAGSSILVYLSYDRSASGVSFAVTDTQNNTYKQISTIVSASTIYTAIFLALDIAGGANTVTAVASGGGSVGSSASHIVASEYTAAAFISEDQVGSATATSFSGSLTASCTPLGSDLLVVFMSVDNDAPLDPPLGYSLRSAIVSLPSGFCPFSWDNQVTAVGQNVTVTASSYIASTPAVLRLIALTPSTTPLYYPSDVVYFGNSFWVCTSQTRTQPSLTSAVWTLLAQGAGGVSSIPIGSGYSAVDGDYGKLLSFSGSGNGTLNLPVTPPEVSWWISVNNRSTGVLSISAGSSSGAAIDGATAAISLLPNTGCLIFTDGFNYYTMRGGATNGIGGGGVNSQTANYLAVAGDGGKLISFNSASAVTLTLPATPPNSTWWVETECVGAGGLTVSGNSLNIDGSGASLSLTQNQGVVIYTDGTNYFSMRGIGGAGGGGVNAQTGTSYTVLSTDLGKLVTFTNASAIAVTLPVASTSGFGAKWYTDVQNIGAVGQGWVTITPTTSTIDGAATLVLQAGSGCRIFSDGTNYFTDRGAASLSLDNLVDAYPGSGYPRSAAFIRQAQFSSQCDLDNADFQASTVMVKGAPPGWFAYPSLTALAYNTGSPYAGTQSLQITGVNNTAFANRAIAVNVGETYQVSGWIKTDGTCTANILFLGQSATFAGVYGEADANTTASTWTYVTATVTMTAGAVVGQVICEISAGSSGSVASFDNIRITRIFGASGTYSQPGLVPDPGGSAGTTRYLREDASWQTVTGSGGGINGVNSQTANYVALSTDSGYLISMNGSSLTLKMPASPPSSTWFCFVENLAATALTLSPNGLDIDGSASGISVAQNTGLIVFTDGTNYFTCRGIGGGGGSPAFSAITSGTNTTAAMVVGAGGSLGTTSSGTIAATSVGGITVTGTPSAGNVLTATSSTAADWGAPAGTGGVPDPNTTRWYYWNADGTQMFSPGSTGSFSQGGVSLTIANPTSGGFGFNSFQGSYVSAYSSAGALANFCTGNSGGLTKPFYMGNNIRCQWAGYWYNSTGTSTASVDWMGFSDQTPTTMGAGGNPAGNYAAFRFIAGTDTNIQCITKDGTTQTVTDSGVAPSAGFLGGTAAYTFEIQTNGSTNVKFYINGTLVATNTTHLPTAATAMNWQVTTKSASSIGVGPAMSYVYFESKY